MSKIKTLLQNIGIYIGVSNAFMFYQLIDDKNEIEYTEDYLGWVALMSVVNPIIFPIYILSDLW